MKINIGAGKTPLEGYINIDRATGGEAYPLSQDGIVFDSGIADEVRASHVLEHFSHRDTLAVLREWIRVLKPNGLLRIAVPDFDQIPAIRAKGDSLWPLYIMGGHTDENDMHGCIFTWDILIAFMSEAGCNIKYSDMYWNDKLDYCSNHPSGVSLNIQGTKRADVKDVEKPIIPKQRKIIGLMSAPRLAFTATHGLIETIFCQFGIKVITYQGAFWEQGMQNCLERAIADGYDDAITLDFDSVFDMTQFKRMMHCWLSCPHIDALSAIQPQRGSGLALLNPLGGSGKPGELHVKNIGEPEGLPCRTAHFGFTFLRLDKLAKLRKPWFWNTPSRLEQMPELRLDALQVKALEDGFGLRFGKIGETLQDSGRWKTGNSVDADIYFWQRWEQAGYNLRVLTDVAMGHLEVMVAQHNQKTGKASYRTANDWCEKPYDGTPAHVIKKDEESQPESAFAYTITPDMIRKQTWPDDKYPQSFVQHSMTCLGEPSKDFSGSKFRNCDDAVRVGIPGKRRIYITFSGSRYHETTEAIVNNANQLGATQTVIYDDSWLIDKHPEFIEARKDIFYDEKGKFTRGFGWFCWKPFIILDALERFCDDGDVVLYSDADAFPTADLSPFFDYAEQHGAMFFAANGLIQRHWCKRDTMRFMQMDFDEGRDRQAGNARYMLFAKGARLGADVVNGKKIDIETFLQKWLTLASNKDLTTFELSQDEYPELSVKDENGKTHGQHRCEQAILTNLVNWYGIPWHRPPCQDWNIGND